MRVAKELIVSEIQGSKIILEKWLQALEAGVPVEDIPGSQDAQEGFLENLCAELVVCAGKLENLASVVGGDR